MVREAPYFEGHATDGEHSPSVVEIALRDFTNQRAWVKTIPVRDAREAIAVAQAERAIPWNF